MLYNGLMIIATIACWRERTVVTTEEGYKNY